jgi:putative transposase
LQGTVKTCRIKRRAGKWYVTFFCVVAASKPLDATGRKVGIDVGISKLITTSDGHSEENPNHYRRSQCRLRLLQRKLARAEKGSSNRRKLVQQVQRQHAHVANQRKDFLDKLTFNLIQDFDFIAVENLQIRNMVRNQHLSKSILDSGWGYFKQRLLDKAAEAGRKVVLVDPAYTTTTCSRRAEPLPNLTLADRWVSCPCGMSLDRDHNAAINILDKAACIVLGKKWVGRTHEP